MEVRLRIASAGLLAGAGGFFFCLAGYFFRELVMDGASLLDMYFAETVVNQLGLLSSGFVGLAEALCGGLFGFFVGGLLGLLGWTARAAILSTVVLLLPVQLLGFIPFSM